MLGVSGAIGTVAIADLPTVGLGLGCVSVGILYVVYPAFSLLWGSATERTIEWSWGLVGILSIVLAIQLDARWLALGWALHGVWDILHRHDHHVVGLRGIPRWYISACLVWDIPAAIGLALAL